MESINYKERSNFTNGISATSDSMYNTLNTYYTRQGYYDRTLDPNLLNKSSADIHNRIKAHNTQYQCVRNNQENSSSFLGNRNKTTFSKNPLLDQYQGLIKFDTFNLATENLVNLVNPILTPENHQKTESAPESEPKYCQANGKNSFFGAKKYSQVHQGHRRKSNSGNQDIRLNRNLYEGIEKFNTDFPYKDNEIKMGNYKEDIKDIVNKYA